MYFKFLWVAVISFFKDIKDGKGVNTALINIDRIFNVIAGGHFLTTISGRVGYFSITKKTKYWKMLESIIDYTFEPLEGKSHCFRTYQWELDLGHTRYRRGNDAAIILLSILVIVGCLILIPIIKLYSWCKSMLK